MKYVVLHVELLWATPKKERSSVLPHLDAGSLLAKFPLLGPYVLNISNSAQEGAHNTDCWASSAHRVLFRSLRLTPGTAFGTHTMVRPYSLLY